MPMDTKKTPPTARIDVTKGRGLRQIRVSRERGDSAAAFRWLDSMLPVLHALDEQARAHDDRD